VLDLTGLWKSSRKTVDNFVENLVCMPANPEKSSLPPDCPSSEQSISFNKINNLRVLLWRLHAALQHDVTAAWCSGFCA
jgi:hypothetical protein